MGPRQAIWVTGDGIKSSTFGGIKDAALALSDSKANHEAAADWTAVRLPRRLTLTRLGTIVPRRLRERFPYVRGNAGVPQ